MELRAGQEPSEDDRRRHYRIHALAARARLSLGAAVGVDDRYNDLRMYAHKSDTEC